MSSKATPAKPSMIIVAGPSGAGKSSFLDKITREIDLLVDIITYTTRPMRAGESEGVPYHFVTDEKFLALIAEDFFVEHANVHGKRYGTPKHQIEDARKTGKVAIMDIDVQGAQTFKAKYPDAFAVFIHPPSIDELRRRVIKRDGQVPKDLEVRMQNAEKEMAVAKTFDAELTNNDFDKSYAQFKKIIEEKLNLR
jgi:guanylate kinase